MASTGGAKSRPGPVTRKPAAAIMKNIQQAKSFRAVATKSLNSSFKGPKKTLSVVSKQKSGDGQNAEENKSENLAEAICDIFSKAVKIPIVADTPDEATNGDENAMENEATTDADDSIQSTTNTVAQEPIEPEVAMESEKKEEEEQKEEKEKNNKMTKGKSKKGMKLATVVMASKKMKKKESLFDGLADWMIEELKDSAELEDPLLTEKGDKKPNEQTVLANAALAKIRSNRMAKMMALRKSAKAENGEVKKVEVAKLQTSFRGMTVTGKYLHENDNRWCVKNTRFATEKEILKWFKRFRALCPKGNMNLEQTKTTYKKLFIPGGDVDFFCNEIMGRFDIDEKNVLDFKVFLFMVQLSFLTTQEEKMRWVFQLMDLDDTGVIFWSELDTALRLYEYLEKRIRLRSFFELEADLEIDPILPLDPNRKSVEERVLGIKDFLKPDEEILMMTKEEFLSIPERLLSTAVDVCDDN